MADETNQNQVSTQPQQPTQPVQSSQAVNQPVAAEQITQPATTAQVVDAAKNAAEKVKSIGPERGWAMVCYIPVFNLLVCALAMVRMVNSKLCRLHARQGLALFLLWFLTIIVALFSPGLSLMLWGIVIVLHIAGFVMAFQRKEALIPVVGKVANMIPEYYVFELLTGKSPDKTLGTEPSQPTQTPQTQPAPPQNPTENKAN